MAAPRAFYRKCIEAVYRRWNDDKMDDISRIMGKYEGQEGEIYDKVVRKYVFNQEEAVWLPLLKVMYKRFNPTKLADLATILSKYKDSEAALYKALCDKYIPLVTLTDDVPKLDVWGRPPRGRKKQLPPEVPAQSLEKTDDAQEQEAQEEASEEAAGSAASSPTRSCGESQEEQQPEEQQPEPGHEEQQPDPGQEEQSQEQQPEERADAEPTHDEEQQPEEQADAEPTHDEEQVQPEEAGVGEVMAAGGDVVEAAAAGDEQGEAVGSVPLAPGKVKKRRRKLADDAVNGRSRDEDPAAREARKAERRRRKAEAASAADNSAPASNGELTALVSTRSKAPGVPFVPATRPKAAPRRTFIEEPAVEDLATAAPPAAPPPAAAAAAEISGALAEPPPKKVRKHRPRPPDPQLTPVRPSDEPPPPSLEEGAASIPDGLAKREAFLKNMLLMKKRTSAPDGLEAPVAAAGPASTAVAAGERRSKKKRTALDAALVTIPVRTDHEPASAEAADPSRAAGRKEKKHRTGDRMRRRAAADLQGGPASPVAPYAAADAPVADEEAPKIVLRSGTEAALRAKVLAMMGGRGTAANAEFADSVCSARREQTEQVD